MVTRTVETSMFGNWDMLHDPAKSWLWSIEGIDAGILKRTSPDDIVTVFAALSEKVAADQAT